MENQGPQSNGADPRRVLASSKIERERWASCASDTEFQFLGGARSVSGELIADAGARLRIAIAP